MVTKITWEVFFPLIFLSAENTDAVLWTKVKKGCLCWYDIAAKQGFSGLQIQV